MITTSKKPGHQYFRKLMVLPVAAIVIGLFAFSYQRKDENFKLTATDKHFTVVIDAGHGGTDPGAIAADGTSEKNIVLAIAQKIKSLNEDPNIKIVLTREDDNSPELKTRSELVTMENANLFLSLHLGSGAKGKESTKNGFEVFVSKKNNQYYSENKIWATILLNYFTQLHTTNNVIRQRDAGIGVLDQAKCPSALVECGYLTNTTDLDFIKKTESQEKIARSILMAIDQYAMQQKSADWEERKENVNDTTEMPSVTKIKWIENFIPSEKKTPKVAQLKIWSDSKTYGVWLDNKRVSSGELSRYKSSDFALYNVSKLAKNAHNYGNHFYQVDLWTNEAFEKMQKNKAAGTKKYLVIKDTTKPLLGNRFEKSLIVIDGKIQEGLKVSDIDKQLSIGEIQSFNVLKGPSAIFNYGDKGKNGVIEIVTKKNNLKEIAGIEKNIIVSDNKVFSEVETEPSFPGGDAKWKQYQKVQLNQNIPIQKGAPKGTYTVIVQFVVKTDSFLINIKALTNHGFGMEEEAVRLISKGPRWIPALQNGKQVNAIRKQPVTFVVTEQVNKLITEASLQKTGNGIPKTPEISLDNLRKATPIQLLQLPEGTEIVSYKFTIDLDDDSIVEVPNTGNSFSPATTNQFNKASAGRMITFERITIMENGKEKKIPAKIYTVTN
jgi:N-acetylmuramoyl-L-alanine amidase